MKKSGFTLAELVITLTIIGVASALVLPAVMNMAPDKYKARILNVYNELAVATENLLNVNKGYYIPIDIAGGDVAIETDDGLIIYPDGINDCEGFSCKYAAGDCEGNNKYACLLAREINAGLTNETKITIDKITIDVKTRTDEDDKITDHILTVNTGFGGNCEFKSGCKKPDIFKIVVENGGCLTPADPLLEAYLLNPMNMHSKDEDFKKAKEFLEDDKKNPAYDVD